MTDERASLISEIQGLGGGPETLVAVELESFFTDNEDLASIAPNLADHPGPQRIYEASASLRDRSDVSSAVVLVRLELDEYRGGEWPFGEAVHITTSASLDEVDAIVTEVHADPSFEGPWQSAGIVDSPTPRADERVVTVWWD